MIAGSAKGHKLKAPKGTDTRPTTDRIKETLFNMISQDIYDSYFLDLYSGTGAIGIEALSRGAQKVVFIDKSSICKKIIEENLNYTKLRDKGLVYQSEINFGLDILKEKNYAFDIIFMDPPYNDNEIKNTLEKIINYNLISPSGYIIIEHSSKRFILNVDKLILWKEKKFKTTTMTFLKLLEE